MQLSSYGTTLVTPIIIVVRYVLTYHSNFGQCNFLIHVISNPWCHLLNARNMEPMFLHEHELLVIGRCYTIIMSKMSMIF